MTASRMNEREKIQKKEIFYSGCVALKNENRFLMNFFSFPFFYLLKWNKN